MEDRLLTPEKILAIKADVKASDFNSLKEFAEGLDQVIVSAQDIKSRADCQREIGEWLCNEIGSAMLDDMEYGRKVGELLNPLLRALGTEATGTFKAEKDDKRGNR